MIIVVDTNIIISAMIKDSVTRKVILQSGLNFVYPEISLKELNNHKQEILDKSGYDEKTFEVILNKLLEYINLVPLEIIKIKLQKSKEIMKNININDATFLATALVLKDSIIWSDDKDFEKQKLIKVLKTKGMLRLLEK